MGGEAGDLRSDLPLYAVMPLNLTVLDFRRTMITFCASSLDVMLNFQKQ